VLPYLRRARLPMPFLISAIASAMVVRYTEIVCDCPPTDRDGLTVIYTVPRLGVFCFIYTL
jgi:hypothetical protein